MSEPRDDKTLDEYLKGDSAVSQRYRELAADPVPPQLDRRVLAQAHTAVRRHRHVDLPAWMRWSKPVALAASVVLAVAIVMEGGIERTAVKATPPAGESQAHLPMSESATPAREDAAPEEEAMAGESAVTPAAPESVPPAAAVREERSATPALEEGHAIDIAQNGADYGPGPSPPQPQGEEPTAEVARVRSGSMQGSALAAAAAPDELSAGIQQSSEQESATSGSHADPNQWLEEIRQLRRDGKLLEADREWERFLAAFPHHPVAPDDLARKRP